MSVLAEKLGRLEGICGKAKIKFKPYIDNAAFSLAESKLKKETNEWIDIALKYADEWETVYKRHTPDRWDLILNIEPKLEEAIILKRKRDLLQRVVGKRPLLLKSAYYKGLERESNKDKEKSKA